MRLIDANALMKRQPDIHDTYDESGDYDYAHGYTINAIKTAPTVDAVPVVRCSECKYNNACFTQSFVESEGVLPFDRDTWFCADGERKGGDE